MLKIKFKVNKMQALHFGSITKKSYGVSEEKRTRTNMKSVIRSNILYLEIVLIKKPGPASQYKMQVNNLFTENFIFCPSRENT